MDYYFVGAGILFASVLNHPIHSPIIGVAISIILYMRKNKNVAACSLWWSLWFLHESYIPCIVSEHDFMRFIWLCVGYWIAFGVERNVYYKTTRWIFLSLWMIGAFLPIYAKREYEWEIVICSIGYVWMYLALVYIKKREKDDAPVWYFVGSTFWILIQSPSHPLFAVFYLILAIFVIRVLVKQNHQGGGVLLPIHTQKSAHTMEPALRQPHLMYTAMKKKAPPKQYLLPVAQETKDPIQDVMARHLVEEVVFSSQTNNSETHEIFRD